MTLSDFLSKHSDMTNRERLVALAAWNAAYDSFYKQEVVAGQIPLVPVNFPLSPRGGSTEFRPDVVEPLVMIVSGRRFELVIESSVNRPLTVGLEVEPGLHEVHGAGSFSPVGTLTDPDLDRMTLTIEAARLRIVEVYPKKSTGQE
jgi:hypothetical protein